MSVFWKSSQNPRELGLSLKSGAWHRVPQRNTGWSRLSVFVLEKMEEHHLDFRRVRAVASIDLKKEEKG